MAKVARIPEAQVVAAAKSDPDTFLLTAADLAQGWIVVPPRKEAIALRVDPDVLAFYRRGGRGYQTRMNAALRLVMDARLKAGRAR
jgi:uncharacterized protein (DUF4415 family)